MNRLRDCPSSPQYLSSPKGTLQCPSSPKRAIPALQHFATPSPKRIPLHPNPPKQACRAPAHPSALPSSWALSTFAENSRLTCPQIFHSSIVPCTRYSLCSTHLGPYQNSISFLQEASNDSLLTYLLNTVLCRRYYGLCYCRSPSCM
jgi:hypothetical protein